MRPLLSIIIVAYKSRGEIEACLRSIPVEIGGGKVEIIVVDNSINGDGTGDFISDLFPGVRYISPERNLGFGLANNLGFQASTGERILFLNPDTVCNENALVQCLEQIEADPRIGFISPRLVLEDGTMDLACRRSIPTIWDGMCRATGLAQSFPRMKLFAGYNLTYLPVDGVYEVGAINGAFMMGRRAVLKEVGLFDSSFFMYGDDLDLCIRMSRAGYRIMYYGKATIIHLKGLSVAKDYDRMARLIFDANRDVYLKHFNPDNSALVRFKYQFAFGIWKRISLLRARLRNHRRVRPI